MRKTIIPAGAAATEESVEWLNLNDTASVEVTSEDPNHPMERAFECGNTGGGWRAASPGEQRIRILFDTPTPVRRVQLRFVETEIERTQEFSLQWFGEDGSHGLIVRQQWNFSPTGSTSEVEDYHVHLRSVSRIELTIRPGSDTGSVASLDCLRIA